MFTPHDPDFKSLWTSADDKTATDWFRWVDGFGGGGATDPPPKLGA